MKKKTIASILTTVCAVLAGAPACTTDAATGRRHLTAESQATLDRITAYALSAAEAAAIRQIDTSLHVPKSGK